MNHLDRVISLVSPAWALQRQQSRNALALSRRYEAAGSTKRTKNIQGGHDDGSTEAGGAAPMLRARARHAVRNNGWAKRGVASMRSSVVGRGVKLTLDGPKALSTKMETSWKKWAESTQCDFYGRKNIYGIQRQVVNSAYVDGEVLVRKVRLDKYKKGVAPLQLQVLEADFLADGAIMGMNDMRSGNHINNGIEFNGEGQVIAYHIYATHPGSSSIYRDPKVIRVPASEMLHIFMSTRPGQNRGASELSAALIKLSDLDDFEDATILRQKIANCFAAFIEGDAGARVPTGDDGYPLEAIEPGMIERLAPGESVTFGNPPATRDYQPFTNRVLQGISASMGVTFESLTNDYSNVNFSSARMAWMEMQRTVEEWQDEIIILQLGGGVWDWFVEAATIAGVAPRSVAQGKLTVSWTPPRRKMLDPVKETKGIVEQLRAGLISWQDAVREMGYDPDILLAQIKVDRERFNVAGLLTSADPAHDKGQGDDEKEPPDKKAAK